VAEVDSDATSTTGTDRSSTHGSVKDTEWVGAAGDDMEFHEDRFLTSANMCRWIINFEDIHLGKQIGMGSYGIVFEGKWKGVSVAVKRFIKQKLDERRMLEFRAEMAFLSQLHHPNIVLFIGACVKRPNLCIVTEYVQQGALKDILSNHSIKLNYQKKLHLLHSAAMGINHLHSLSPSIIHRDLKSSNLLVDENWNVKVADFGFARIKEENATMTRCGTPCWTAPEVLRGEKYSDAADVFSFGIVMWEVLTRRQPYAGLNFMAVTLDVLEGRRPPLPTDLPKDMKKMIKQCWHANPAKRPSMSDVLAFFNTQVGAKLDEHAV
jgi:serine/threonine protein kinase